MNDDADQRGPIIHRVRTVAAGFADVGLTHAEELLRRVSPEGREQARREREAKARRHKRVSIQLMMAMAVALLAWAVLAAIASPAVAMIAASAVMILLGTLIFLRAEPSAPGREALTQASLAGLAEETSAWLAAQRRGLPPAALQITAALDQRLADLSPVLGRLDPNGAGADGLRKLVAVELPDLVESWRTVPLSLRRTPGADGRTPNDHLVNGLRLIETQLAVTSEQLPRSARDDVAVLGRYLELKYDSDSRLS